MSSIGDALEVAFGSAPGYTSLIASGRHWSDFPLAVEAGNRADERDGEARGRSAHPDGGASEDTWRRWFQEPDRSRCEYDERRGLTTVVHVGGDTWAWDPDWGGHTNGGRRNHAIHMGPGEGLLLSPHRLLSDLVVIQASRTEILERPAFELDCTPRVGARPVVGRGADEVRLWLDIERAVLLRCEALLDLRPFLIHEFTSIEFDTVIDPGLFTLETPDGSAFRGPDEHPR